MSGFAQITVIGNVGKDPEIRSVGNSSVASFSLAYTERWTSKQSGERNERTTWFLVEAWSNDGPGTGLVNVVKQYVAKGTQLMVQGLPVIEEFTDKDGNNRRVFKVRLSGPNAVLRLLGSPGGRDRPGSSVETKREPGTENDHPQGTQQTRQPAMADDDIPF